MDGVPLVQKIKVGSQSLGMLMNTTYNEDPFMFEGYY